MTTTLLTLLGGILVVLAITAATGYFVAQEFAYMAVDRSRLKARAEAGDTGAKRALGITSRTSFMLSGAQLGITVTGLLVGYVAEPMIGNSIGTLLGGVNVPSGVGIAIGTTFALLFATVVQMVFGELFPKNLAISRPEPVARALAMSTAAYLAVFGWLIRIFDAASNLLLKALRIEPVHDVEHSATPRDLEAIIDESHKAGEIDEELSQLLDRVLEFTDRTARSAMIPRPRVTSVSADATITDLVGLMKSGHSRLPVIADGADDVVGLICLRDVLAMEGRDDLDTVTVSSVMRTPLLVPASLPLPTVLERIREQNEEFACVVDEYGGLAGVITTEDIAEELVGEITDEHDAATERSIEHVGDAEWVVPGTLSVDEIERLVDGDLPEGDYQTIGGLVIAHMQKLPHSGDSVEITVTGETDEDGHTATRPLTVTVTAVERRVPAAVRLALAPESSERERVPSGSSEAGR